MISIWNLNSKLVKHDLKLWGLNSKVIYPYPKLTLKKERKNPNDSSWYSNLDIVYVLIWDTLAQMKYFPHCIGNQHYQLIRNTVDGLHKTSVFVSEQIDYDGRRKKTRSHHVCLWMFHNQLPFLFFFKNIFTAFIHTIETNHYEGDR